MNVNGGELASSFQNGSDVPILNEKIKTPTFLVGFDFLPLKGNQNTYLSSQIGYQKIGGKEIVKGFSLGNYSDLDDYVAYQKSHFLHTNIIFKYIVFKNKKILNTFIGLGPYLNVLLNDKGFTEPIYTGFAYKRIHIGGKPELGATVDIKRVRIGFSGYYLFNITPTASSEYLKLNSPRYGFMLSAGYKI